MSHVFRFEVPTYPKPLWVTDAALNIAPSLQDKVDIVQNAVDFVTEVNQRLSDNDIVRDQGGFITLLYCMLDTRGNRLQWSSAGHPMPMLQNLDTNEVTVLGDEDSSGLPLGIDGDQARG